MTIDEAKSFLINISYQLGNMGIEYLTEKDGEKMREAIKALEQQPCEEREQGKCPFYALYEINDISIKATLNEIHDIHERIKQCNERYEKRMAELERPVEFYNINGPLKITREEDNNG